MAHLIAVLIVNNYFLHIEFMANIVMPSIQWHFVDIKILVLPNFIRLTIINFTALVDAIYNVAYMENVQSEKCLVCSVTSTKHSSLMISN